MQKHIENVKQFMKLAGQNVPVNKVEPDKDTRLLRAQLILEEALEMCEALGVKVLPKYNESFIESQKDLTFYLDGDANLVGIADAAIDLLWVGVTGPMIDIGCSNRLEDCVAEVDRSNLSKFIDGHKCPNTGKWIKGPSYSPANIQGVLDSEI